MQPAWKPAAVGALLYAGMASMAAHWGLAAWQPCTASFEGGCGQARAVAGLLSWLAALLAVALGGRLQAWSCSAGMPRLLQRLLWLPVLLPFAYVVVLGVVLFAPDLLRSY